MAILVRLPASAVVALLFLFIGLSAGQSADRIVRGSGVVIGIHGEVLTNAHVVKDCTRITVRSSPTDSVAAHLVASDDKNDLAVLSGLPSISSPAAFRSSTPVREGDAVVVMGYPLSGILATTANLTLGNVSALAGLRDDTRYLQISAPVQPGNSGGPLLDSSGHLVGIVTAKLNAALIAAFTGDIPQNVNFALKAEVARTFLDGAGIEYRTARSDKNLSAADVGDIGRPFTVQVECVSATPFGGEAATGLKMPATSQRAILYEEDPSTPRGRSYNGLTTWRTTTLPSTTGGTALETAVVAQAIIPEQHLAVSWTLRRNTNQSFDASHLIEINFSQPVDRSTGGIGSVPGVLMKVSETAKGVPLAGVMEKARNSYFLFGLSPNNMELQQNLQLLKDRQWVDIAIVYNNGSRAILALQKGPPGDRAFADAFAAWKE